MFVDSRGVRLKIVLSPTAYERKNTVNQRRKHDQVAFESGSGVSAGFIHRRDVRLHGRLHWNLAGIFIAFRTSWGQQIFLEPAGATTPQNKSVSDCDCSMETNPNSD